ncbi:NUDIX hydrolase [Actinoalloteichus hymeniacidonis]|uniref:ADP-ribose pyrophosphatase n=1 Tax=Actinoalloteichus hymeniacidonis TaxID=340345 RepID=A0AAC9HVU2_9PSEU|nr:NUDIX hydrolase [Actinoalloteichus hymeniacidonis]AOS66086.1 ADP-ribose pyrophosphatase [Actinoalloteichus hymeniacidonis]MBB5905810.1 8-oxo-dGTP pyrophosphatase MutT (NUDIX family) [Actinoalloteichus hymeniacidonis]
MTDLPPYSVSVAGVVTREDGRILVIRRADNGRWEPPGGILERAETAEDGVRREVLEETGVEVVVNRLTGVYQNLGLGVIALVFRCVPTGTVIDKVDGEAREITWLTAAEAATAMTPAFAVRVADALSGAGARFRAHDGTNLLSVRPATDRS